LRHWVQSIQLGILVHQVRGLQRAFEQITHQVFQFVEIGFANARPVYPVGEPVLKRS
jgi:hypothetical protein